MFVWESVESVTSGSHSYRLCPDPRFQDLQVESTLPSGRSRDLLIPGESWSRGEAGRIEPTTG